MLRLYAMVIAAMSIVVAVLSMGPDCPRAPDHVGGRGVVACHPARITWRVFDVGAARRENVSCEVRTRISWGAFNGLVDCCFSGGDPGLSMADDARVRWHDGGRRVRHGQTCTLEERYSAIKEG
jgi:hypothetical protein